MCHRSILGATHLSSISFTSLESFAEPPWKRKKGGLKDGFSSVVHEVLGMVWVACLHRWYSPPWQKRENSLLMDGIWETIGSKLLCWCANRRCYFQLLTVNK